MTEPDAIYDCEHGYTHGECWVTGCNHQAPVPLHEPGTSGRVVNAYVKPTSHGDTECDKRAANKCLLAGCGHALSMHNSLGYCRSRTTPDGKGECICDGTPDPARHSAHAQGGPIRATR